MPGRRGFSQNGEQILHILNPHNLVKHIDKKHNILYNIKYSTQNPIQPYGFADR